MTGAQELKTYGGSEAARVHDSAAQDAVPELARLRRVWAIAAAPIAAGAVGLVVNAREPELALALALASLAVALWARGPLQAGVGLAATMTLGVIARGLGGVLGAGSPGTGMNLSVVAPALIPFAVAAATAPGRRWTTSVVHTGVCGAASLFAFYAAATTIPSPLLGVAVWGAITCAVIALSHRMAR